MHSKLITPTTAGTTFGHRIVLKAGTTIVIGSLTKRLGGIEPFLVAYISEFLFPPYYPKWPLEQEAERLANTVGTIPA